MSDTDIYKQREPLPYGGQAPKRKRRRRSDPNKRFDDPKKRRGRNSGLRRLLHLARKSENEKYFWGVLGTLLLTLLIVVGVWQFIIRERMLVDATLENEPAVERTSRALPTDEPIIVVEPVE